MLWDSVPSRLAPYEQPRPITKARYQVMVFGRWLPRPIAQPAKVAGDAEHCTASTAQQSRQHVDDMSLVLIAATCAACAANPLDRFVLIVIPVAGLWTIACSLDLSEVSTLSPRFSRRRDLQFGVHSATEPEPSPDRLVLPHGQRSERTMGPHIAGPPAFSSNQLSPSPTWASIPRGDSLIRACCMCIHSVGSLLTASIEEE